MGRKQDNTVMTKSKNFAIRIVKLYKYLTGVKSEYVMSKQLLRCGTSIGANVCEAQEAISKKDFTSKIYIAAKEARETEYWLELLNQSGDLSDCEYESINSDCDELLKILVSITKTIAER